ncbi:uncharacterized protein C2845_PM16G12220 [Panicum miliaceum]|uniref:Uncharacterized protein n=1 Tax=Panicum miliaceum TaxID=4540 RepID=A0A3L6Q132_PANMI|nr:uncharacterized protein C2845_PM16G12220 [Panicum miliaceum]
MVQDDPVSAISQATISDLIGLSLSTSSSFLCSSPMAEGLFNSVIAWTLMLAPLLFVDSGRDRYKGSLEALWGFQMLLTNTFLVTYMAIRLNAPGCRPVPATKVTTGFSYG